MIVKVCVCVCVCVCVVYKDTPLYAPDEQFEEDCQTNPAIL